MEKFKYSWNARTPMTSPDMVAKQIKWTPMNKSGRKTYKKCSYSTKRQRRIGLPMK